MIAERAVLLLFHVFLQRPLGQYPPPRVREPVVDLVDGKLSLCDKRLFLVVVGVRVVLVISQPVKHVRHRLRKQQTSMHFHLRNNRRWRMLPS